MFVQSIRLGKILGIPVGVNYSWFIVFVLITMTLSTQFAYLHPGWTGFEQLMFGVITSLLFFLSVLLHELGHSVMAIHYGIPVRSITLFIFGGVAQIGREPSKPAHEFNIALAGPVVSALLGALFYGLMFVSRSSWEGVASLGRFLGSVNLFLALFNLIPGFPLDGGRVLRALVWKLTGSFEKATTLAASSGQLFAYGFIFYGIWQALHGNFMQGLWIGFIGWFLLNAAQFTHLQMRFRLALRGVTARDVMSEDCLRLSGSLSVAELVEHHMLRSGARCAMVVEGEHLRGLVTRHEIQKVPQEEWPVTSLQAVMRPVESMLQVSPEAPVMKLLQKMNEQKIAQIPVVEHGRLLGMVGRDRLLALVETHLELKH